MASMPSLPELDEVEFVDRHVGPDDTEIREMLAVLGFSSLDELLDRAVPASIRTTGTLALGPALSEVEVLDRLREKAAKNRVLTSLIGMGYYGTVTPAVILRNVLENPGWYTAYTPYQPEISQGRLEALLNFQTMVCDLTGMEIANASLLDEGTAAAEAMTMARRLSRAESEVFFVDSDCHPQTIEVVRTRAEPLGIEVLVGSPATDLEGRSCYGALLQYPGTSGNIPELAPVVQRVQAQGGLLTVAADLLALTLLESPGHLGADIVVGTSQRFGVPLAFGGPHAAFLATREEYRRSLPGRLVGVSVDAAGRRALRLALQTREQHIRRERATSNICTAQVLLAVVAAMYAVYHGPDGLRGIAERVQRHTATVARALRDAGVDVVNETFFDTLTVRVPGTARAVLHRAVERGMNLRLLDADTLAFSFDETTSGELVRDLLELFSADIRPAGEGGMAPSGLPTDLLRRTPYLTNPVFNLYHSETEMLRYLRRLSDLDIALDRSMIPLGSCTMKLNATAEMAAITWPEFAAIHPFAPLDQAQGYLELIAELQAALAEITGYHAVSLQPNAGSQGELAGLLAIRRYYEVSGEGGRDICLIPASAHGTNAASAAMAGMKVVVVACDDDGNVDLADLAAKIDQHKSELAVLMVTYPSTHGVFEESIREICDLVHANGAQVYLDGANLNALVGVAGPARFGSDVSHLNLHKTFAIPHGGGGPGVGPVAAREHLAPFLPNHGLTPEAGPATGVGPISAAPWGSAGVLPISWAYLKLMGAEGLLRATKVAILNANYVAARLSSYFPVLYTGCNGLVAHECIIDVRPAEKRAKISVEDVAKRLIDYGFHAPTMSFPVAGTLMIEPTESEGKRELDRFCEAMVAIHAEIEAVATGDLDPSDNPLKHAPHTAEDVTADEWPHAYAREQAAFPLSTLRGRKYWPPVSRIDGAYGDRNLVCACLPVEVLSAV
ncbi:MAG: Glycine dehydrogenase (decarboxylating) [Acidimicrobiales bacterium]|nr:MAG: glycine dehydrogenase (aminomethyl-transferring) [Actinomycetota bacterium]MBV6507194.1 Glycine dehydrogenase (decarboxylating) [Acidimicrobiales bacterium]RIK05518.1 MAG: glycine dehydrogenase (aminomethyl-transferring) [Acidobacteriota bacterium]